MNRGAMLAGELDKVIKESKYIACIAEGGAESAIINLLLDYGKLKFTREQLLEQEPIRERNGDKFAKRYLGKGFTEEILILRILDSRRENFIVKKAYQNKIKLINVITAPEIEMLIILNEKKYDKFKKTGKKPSDYCIEDMNMKDVKTREFICSYFVDIDTLVNAIREYKRVAKVQKGEWTLYDLLK